MTDIIPISLGACSYCNQADSAVSIMQYQLRALREAQCARPHVVRQHSLQLQILRDELNDLIANIHERENYGMLAWLAGKMVKV